MIVDSTTDSKLLNPAVEDVMVTYRIEPTDDKTTLLVLLNGLLTFKIGKMGYCSSIIDFFILRNILKTSNFNFNIKLTDRCLEDCKKYIEYRQKIQDIKDGKYNHELCVIPTKTKPFSDQLSAIRLFLERKKALNASSVGIGKTLTALGTFASLKCNNLIDKGLVFCLNENKRNWENEIKKHTVYSHKVVGNGTDKVLKDIEESNEDLLVVHYDSIINEYIKAALIKKGYNFIIVDEAHILKNKGSRRSNTFFDILEATEPKYVIMLTGTPVPESPLNAYPILQIINKNIVPTKERFDNHFCNFFTMKIKNKRIRVINKNDPHKHLEQLKFLMEFSSFRKTQAEVQGFPEILFSVREVDMEKDQNELYNTILNETYTDIAAMPEKTFNLSHVLTKTTRLRQCLSHPILLGEKASSIKFKILDQILDEVLEDKQQKIVVWSPFRQTLELIKHKYSDSFGAVLFAGLGEDMSNEERDASVQRFISDSSCRLMAAITNLGTGNNWGVAATAIYMDEPLSHLQLVQSRGRITRRDSKYGTCSIIALNVRNSVDAWVRNLHESKEKTAAEIIGEDQEVKIDKEELLEGLHGRIR